jgi:hypothetical protein
MNPVSRLWRGPSLSKETNCSTVIQTDTHTENYAMRPKVDRVTFSSNALQYVGEYVGDIILNLLIVASTFALLMFGILLFSS